MLKGVNKNIIEISDTGNDIFDRAILFVNPRKYADNRDNRAAIERNALDYVSQLNPRRAMFRKTEFWLLAAKLTASAAFGAVVAAIVLM